jgi:acetyltransferase-like isoleucine patch superfamily enzyme
MAYRQLTIEEREQLQHQGCTATDWDAVEVVEGFEAMYVQNVAFSGKVRLGRFERSFVQPGGFEVHSGVYHARLHNVTIGDDCYIDRIHNYIANYEIGDDVFIENTNLIVVDGEAMFGNGVRVPVMNESGGREVPIYDNLSAHLAYILTLYRHEYELIAKLENLIDEYVEEQKSDVGKIGNNVHIVNCGTIKNVRIGDCATLGGVSKLKNGSINSNCHAPVHIGSGVKCNDFILCSGVDITDSTLVSRCFVGQGTVMGKHYSALDSLFFSNCQGFHGEATAIFAGPYTVSHHKSSLLIAGMYSFLNAGSGSNQSNHMYKLGPIHQGMAERGSKTTSDSYILWPARIGAFTLVMGRHTKHSDTSELPFSYLIENATESYLVPGVNLRSVGTVRDAQKWPKRDNRKDLVKIDHINFNLLSPYTIQKMYRAVALLKGIQQMAGANNEVYSYQNCRIKNSSLVRGVELYEMAITKFLGNSLISRIGKEPIKTIQDLRDKLLPTYTIGSGEWLDVSGLIAPQSEIDGLVKDIVAGSLSLKDIEQQFAVMHKNYYDYEWTWAYDKLLKYWNKSIDKVTIDDLVMVIEAWKMAVVALDKMLYNDAKKEFDLNSKTGFGVDGDESVRMRDFESVRGSFEENPFVKECLQHIERKTKLGNDTIELLKNICI